MKLKLLVLAMLVGWSQVGFAATFKFVNNSGALISLKPNWKGDSNSFVTIKDGESSGEYNSVFSDLVSVTWSEAIKSSPENERQGIICTKRFTADLNIVWSALGGVITILPGGGYAYDFSTMAGHGSGKGAPTI
jgi:hypothetical protein